MQSKPSQQSESTPLGHSISTTHQIAYRNLLSNTYKYSTSLVQRIQAFRMLSGTSLGGILGLIFGPPILIFFSVMALKIYLRITANEEALNQVRSTMQARRSRHILGLEGGSAALSISIDPDSFVDIEQLAQHQTRQTREERIQDCINVFTVPDNSSAFIRFAANESDQVSEMEASSQFSSARFDGPVSSSTIPNGAPRASQGTPSVKSAQQSVKSEDTGKKSERTQKSQKSKASQKSRFSMKSRASTRSSGRASRRASMSSIVSRMMKSKRASVADVCMICMDGYRHGDVVCKTRCAHIFHKDCVEEWMKKHNRCPLCRKDLFSH